MGVLEAARAAGLRAPEDLSVIGYDDIEMSSYLRIDHNPPTPVMTLVARGVDLLLDAARPARAPVCQVLPTELMVRTDHSGPGRFSSGALEGAQYSPTDQVNRVTNGLQIDLESRIAILAEALMPRLQACLRDCRPAPAEGLAGVSTGAWKHISPVFSAVFRALQRPV